MLSKLLIILTVSQSPRIFVEPARVEKFYLKGKVYTEVFMVESREAPSHIEVYAEDFIINEKGEAEFKKKLKGYSLKNFVKISPRAFDLEANEKKEVRVSFTLPDTMRTLEKWCMIIFRGYPRLERVPQIRIVREIGVPIYAILPQGNVKSAELLDMGFKSNEPYFVVYNLSPVHIRTKGKVYIEEKGKIIWEKPFLNFVILPFQKRRYKFKIGNNIKKGKYKLICEIDYGTEEILKGEKIIEIK